MARSATRNKCNTPGCVGHGRAQGLCDSCYGRARRSGTLPAHYPRLKHGRKGTPEYSCWQAMNQRCQNPKHKAFPDYGGRGILVCSRWRDSFEAFYEDMGLRPSPGHTIERRDNDGNYEPSNCIWATMAEQARNRRSARWIECNGKRLTIGDWAKELGVSHQTINARLKHYTPDVALSQRRFSNAGLPGRMP